MRNLLFALLLLPFMASCVKDTAQVTLDSLLDEMISVEESARYPLVPYRCLQVSSYDRSSVSPDSPGWFANNDGYGIVCTDTVLFTEITIHDSGAGFEKEALPHIFERFYSGKSANRAGYGIGLALCRMIIIRQGGTITAKNHPQGGAVFTIRFPK